MLGRFQTANLEARIGQYRMANQLCKRGHPKGEKKMSGLLKSYTKSKCEFSDPCKAKCDTKSVDSFPYNKVANKVSNNDLSSLL